VAAAAAAMLLLFVVPAGDGDGAQMQARGSAGQRDRWVSIQAFQPGQGGYQPVTTMVSTQQPLAFAYLNRSSVGYSHLMIFAVDANGRIYWYYPAHEDPTEDPRSIAIGKSDKAIELPDQVRHELAQGPLRVFGLFTRRALAVHEVEALVARDLRAAGHLTELTRLQLEDAGQHSFLVQAVAADGAR